MDNTTGKNILDQATGDVAYTLTNDLLFHMVMQDDEDALKGLLSALLGLKLSDISKVEIRNPIDYGTYKEDKEIVLDILLTLNNNHNIDIEMQVDPYEFWTNRSLFYTCRMVSQQKVGKRYQNLRKVTHIGILDHTLFPEAPRFYAEYKLLETHSGYPYTDLFSIRVLDLRNIELAEEGESQLVYWARLFRATTWEAIRQVAANDTSIRKAAETMAAILTDEQKQIWLEQHEKYLMDQASIQEELRRKTLERDAAVAQAKAEIEEAKAEIEEAKAKAEEAAVREKEATVRAVEAAERAKEASAQMKEAAAKNEALTEEIRMLRAELAKLQQQSQEET